MIEWLHPGAIFILGALLLLLVKGKVRKGVLLLTPVASFLAVLLMNQGNHGAVSFLGQSLLFGKVDRLSLVFAVVFTIMGFIGAVYAFHVEEVGQHVAAFIYVGSSLGVVFAGDYFTLFVFWEAMAFSSVFLIWYRGPEALWPGFRYILVHAFSGVCLLGGIVLILVNRGNIAFGPIGESIGAGGGNLASTLILIGFIINAAVPPLHAWLADAYPEATVTGSVFLCAFTTKTAVYVLVRAFSGTEILVWLGVIMSIYGVVYAVMENDIRRLLAYHIISQVGYMVAGVGMGTEMAQNGAVAHAFAHILYKGLLFMGTGAVIYMTGRRKLTELGGLYKTMPWTMALYMIGGFSISAFPLFSGFVSKSMVIAAAAEDHRPWVVLLLTLASSGTFLHTGLKLPYYIFFGKDAGIQAKEPPKSMLIAMVLAAFLCILIGVAPGTLYGLLPYPVHFVPYTADHVASMLSILLFTALGFFLLLRQLDPEPTISLDTDWFYRMGGRVFLWTAQRPIAAYEEFVGELYNRAIIRPGLAVARICALVDTRIIDGTVNEVGRTVFSGSGFSTFVEKYVVYGFLNFVAYANHIAARIFRRLQTGSVHAYAMIIIIGIFILVNLYQLLTGSVPVIMLVLK
ncbi:MAG TPA: Na(+)/H(+) antiporter subunit D [Nitrospiria bacterium]|nr:Na(+)/H(+) antiporter subunit D [Nitrospiria bacterium]